VSLCCLSLLIVRTADAAVLVLAMIVTTMHCYLMTCAASADAR